jgi:uncharacterized membrane protein YeaQ/YmgE (transglycosylase-associated protein family)
VKVEWRGLVAAILAVGIAGAVIAGLIGTVFNNRSLSLEEETLFAGIVGGMVAALAGYLASKDANGKNGKDKDQDHER